MCIVRDIFVKEQMAVMLRLVVVFSNFYYKAVILNISDKKL